MDPTAWITVTIAAVGCLITSATLIVKVTRAVSSIEPIVTAKITETINKLKREFEEENDKLRFELAETLKPIQTHISLYEEKHYKLELYIRDNYIEVDTFRNALEEIKELIREVKDSVKVISKDDSDWRKERRDIEGKRG